MFLVQQHFTSHQPAGMSQIKAFTADPAVVSSRSHALKQTILGFITSNLPFLFSLSPPCAHQNPDIVLVHYLNVPAIEDCGKPCGPILCSINTDKKEWAKWTKEELIGQLKPMCEYLSDSN